MSTKDRDIDKLAAKDVMGWTYINGKNGECWAVHIKNGYYDSKADGNWSPTTSASDDYEILKHVIGEWNYSMFRQFCQSFFSTTFKRTEGPVETDQIFALYEPGDYSRAALSVTESKNDKA